MEKETPVKSYSKFQMAGLYGVSMKVFMSWVKRWEKILMNQYSYSPRQKIFTIAQVEFLFEKLGRP